MNVFNYMCVFDYDSMKLPGEATLRCEHRESAALNYLNLMSILNHVYILNCVSVIGWSDTNMLNEATLHGGLHGH